MLPTYAVFASLSQPLMALLFERGQFGGADTARAAAIFLGYSPQLPFTAIDYLLINAFYARQNARTPVLVGVVGVLLYLAVALVTIAPFGAVGLAVANAIQNSSHALILLVLLERHIPGLHLWQSLLPFLVKTIPAAAASAAAILLGWPLLAPYGNLLASAIASLLATAVYVALLLALRVPEASQALALIRRR
jgi:putative peptidoglycan lipid II flippase